VGLAIVLATLVLAAEIDAIGGWWFGFLSVVAVFAPVGIAMALDARVRPDLDRDVPLEWVGIDRPYRSADVRAIDAVVLLPEVASR
jgi:hypothetical protein